MIEFPSLVGSREVLQNAFDFAQNRVKAIVARDPGFYPMYTEGGRWRHGKEAWTNWCDGFLPGMMWIFAKRCGGEWAARAESYTTPLEHRKMDRGVHDLGFIFLSTYHRWYALTGRPELNEVVIQAGRTLALRFREKGRYMPSFMGPESLFIDIMANVGIVFHAAMETGDAQLMDVAMQHCLTTRRVLIRGDGSSSHEGEFTTCAPANSCGNRRSRATVPIPVGRAAWLGRSTALPRLTSALATPAFSTPPSSAPTTTSKTRRPTACL